MKVLQLQNNQYLIFMNDRVIFQSYQTIIAYYDKKENKIYKDKTFYSRTTSKYFGKFMRMCPPSAFIELVNPFETEYEKNNSFTFKEIKT